MKKLLIVLAVVVGLGFYVNAFAELQVVDGPITAQSVTVNGQITIKGGSPGAGKVLTSDATGLATWQTSAASGIGGSGTTNYFPIFTGTSTLGNSVVYQTGSNVGVGTTSPSYKLDVTGGGRFTDNLVLTRSMDQLKFEVPSALRYWFMSKPSVNYAFGWYSPDEIGWLMYLKTGTGDLILPGANKIGVGTASPLARLQLGGSNYETNLLSLGAFDTTYVKSGRLGAIYPYVVDSRLIADNSGWGFGWTHENVNDGAKYTMMYLGPDGQYGSNYRLWLDGSISLGDVVKSYADIGSGFPTMSANIKLDPAGTSYINGGNVGIGNTTPNVKLDVTGTIEENNKKLCKADGTDCPAWCPPRSVWVNETNTALEDERASYANCARGFSGSIAYVDLSNPHIRDGTGGEYDIVGYRGDNGGDDCQQFCKLLGFNYTTSYCTQKVGTSCTGYASAQNYDYYWIQTSSTWLNCSECESCRCFVQ